MAQMKTMGSGALGNSETRRIVSDVVNDATDGGNTGEMLSFLTSVDGLQWTHVRDPAHVSEVNLHCTWQHHLAGHPMY